MNETIHNISMNISMNETIKIKNNKLPDREIYFKKI